MSVESTGYYAVNLQSLTVMGGTLSAKAVEPYSAIMVADEVPTFAENYKVCKADTPQEKTSYGNAQGVRILITECTEHDFGYAASETSGMHKVACKLCSVFREEAHDFSFGSEPSDQMKHYLTCACGAKSVTAEYHNFVCTPNNDSLTHGTACSVCGYEKADSSSEEHDFTSDKTLCSKCGFKRGVSIRFGDTLINREKFADVLDLAMGGSGSSTDGVITVYGNEESFPGTQITVKWGKFTIDLNGAKLAFPGITLFDINRNANVTIKNGKLNLAGNTIYNDNPGIMDRSGGLTLEDVEITASCNTSNGHVQYPAVKVLFNFSNPQTFTAKNVIFNGGFEARGSASITPFTNGSFVYSCPEATHENPVIKVGQNITDIIADGYALAKYDDNTQLVPMYQYDETGARVDLNEIWESVTVVPHPEHTFTNGVCGCGYRCEHAGGFDADGICQSCGAHAVASVGDEMFTQLDVAFARANELSASTGENIKINILYDLGDTAGSGTATAKITLDLNGHDFRKCQFFVGKKDESGNVTAEGDLTIVDSGELTNGQIDKVTLYGGKLAVTDGYSMDIDVYGGEAFITDHIAENISVYGGTANLTDGSANDISVYKGKLNVSGSAVNRLFVNSDGKTHIFDGKITKATLRGGETTISDGRIADATLSDGELHITNGLTSNLLVSGGKAYISNESYGTAVPTFEMTAGEAYITGGNFDDFTVNITNADNTNPKLEIEDGTFGRTSFAAATQGRITLYGGIFDHVSIDVLPGSTVRTFGDILAENHMFYKVSDRSLIPNSTDKIDESAEVKRHRHVYTEKSNADGSYYGECACGYKAEAVIEAADSSKTYYDTFEKAAAAIEAGNTLKLCFDTVCENDVTIEQKGAYDSHVTLNLNGKKLSFEDGKRLSILDSYIDVKDNESESGYVSYLYVNWSTTRLYGGSYGKLQSGNENLLKSLRGNGCGFKSLASNEWITSFGWASSLTDVAVKPVPYTVKAVVTNTPDGTETPAVIYAGQTVYFKLIFTVNSGKPDVSESSPASSSLDYIAANGKSYVIGTKLPVTGSGAFAQITLAEDAAAGAYKALFENIEYLGCLQDIDVWFEVKICTHDSYTNGICDICGLPCKHTNVGEDGKCGACQTEFSFQLITKDGASSYYTAFKDALIAANLEENKGCTVKLFKDVTMTQAERSITLNGGEFTLDLNGYTVRVEAKTEPTHTTPYILLTDVDMTLKTSTVRNTYTSFYPLIQIYDGTVFKSSHDFTDSYLHIDEINFPQSSTTGKVSLETGVHVVNLHKVNNQMTSGEVLEDGCVFRTSYGNNIIPRSDTSTTINKMFVIKCPHDWNGNTCNYCGLICDHPNGYVNSVIFSGNRAKLNAGNPLIIINTITVKNGATWSSILPNANLHGYQVYNSDKSGYKWYDAGMLEAFLGDGNTINNVKLQSLPVTKDLILMVDGQKIATQSNISVYKPFVFSFESWVDNGWNGSGVLFIQKEGDAAPTPVNADGESDIYTCPEMTFDISESGTYTVWAEVSKQGYTRRSKTYTLNVGAYLQDAQIALKQSEFTYTPLSDGDAEEFRPEIDSVKLFGHDVPADAYTINGETTGTDARTYTMTITAKEGSGYIGSVSVNWTIHPRVLTEVGVGTYIKKYDGTTEITVDNIGKNDSPPHFFYDGCPAGGIVLKYDEDFKLGDLNANFSYPNAGEYADVSFTVELKNSNYTFKDNDSNDTKYKTVDTGVYIEQADLPTGCEPGEGGVTVRNGVAHTYTYDVSALLKQLTTGLSYGTKSYTVASTYIMDGGYLDEGSVSIDENGVLSIPVKKVLALADAEVARITVTVHAQNYADFTVTVMVYARNQIVPTGEPMLSDNGTITYGDKISKIQLSGKPHDDINNTDVEGTFAWENPNEEPSGAGDHEAAWVFTPTGDNAYLYAPVTGKATIKVNKAPLVEGVDYETPTAITGLVYKVNDNTPQTLHTSGRVIGTVGTMKYTTGNPESADTVWSDTPLTSRDAGEFVVYCKVFGDSNHLDSAYGTISCRIAKYKLAYEIVCLPKVYDGTKNGDPKNIASITFFGAEDKTKVVLTEKDYTVESIVYKSENVGGNLGTIPVSATASVKLNDTNTASNYELAEDQSSASGCITPAHIEGIDFHGYTFKVLYINTYAKTVSASSLQVLSGSSLNKRLL